VELENSLSLLNSLTIRCAPSDIPENASLIFEEKLLDVI
jgi:hypothetical protein